MSRILAIDFGAKRTGLAVTDELQLIASGLTTVETPKLLNYLEDYCKKENVGIMVVGAPKRLNNVASDIEKKIAAFVEKLKLQFPDISIERVDERFTSKMAFQSMLDGGLKKKQRQNKALLDEISATIILQSYLNSK